MFEQFWYVAPPWMSNVMDVFVWSVAGGGIVAVVLAMVHRRFKSKASAIVRDSPLVTMDAMNMAHLCVVGGAGLMLVGPYATSLETFADQPCL